MFEYFKESEDNRMILKRIFKYQDIKAVIDKRLLIILKLVNLWNTVKYGLY